MAAGEPAAPITPGSGAVRAHRMSECLWTVPGAQATIGGCSGPRWRADVEAAFLSCEIADVEAYTDPDPIARVLKFNEVFYRLRRK